MKKTLTLTKKPKPVMTLTRKKDLIIPKNVDPRKVALDKAINSSLA